MVKYNKVYKATTKENKTGSNLIDFFLFYIFVCTFNTKESHIYILSFRNMSINKRSNYNRESKHTVAIQYGNLYT